MILSVVFAIAPVAQSSPAKPGARQGTGSDVVVVGKSLPPLTEDEREAAPRPPMVPRYRPDLVGPVAKAARRSARCAGKSALVKPSLWRNVIDGVVDSSEQNRSLDWIVRQTSPCGLGQSVIKFTGDAIAQARPMEAVLYRNALMRQALVQYTPRLWLTHAQLIDVAVQRRFAERERVLNKARLSIDRALFQVAACAVLAAPEDAIPVAMSEDPRGIRRYIAGVVLRSPECVGGAKALAVDPWQFQGYVADAVYRWAVAAKGVDSLLPAE